MGGKYDVIQIIDDREKYIFSNTSKSSNAVIAGDLRSKSFAQIKQLIE
jgi:hypothetical protein